MAEAVRWTFAVFMVLFGLGALVGWVTAFRNRLYLAPIGVAFIASGAAVTIPTAEPGTPDTLGGLRLAAWLVAGALFLVGVVLAAAEVRREMQAIQEQRRGLEREMQEYLTRLEAEHKPEDSEQ